MSTGFTEADLYEQQRRKLPGTGTRIENAITSGVFDAYWTIRGRGHWIENKIQHGNQILVRPSQFAWGTTQLSHGATNVWFFVAKSAVDPPLLFFARDVLDLVSFDKARSGKFVVDVRARRSRASGWANIIDAFVDQRAV
jgi:hypothetical protein